MKSFKLIVVTTIAFVSTAVIAPSAFALGNTVSIRNECGSSMQKVTGTTENFSNSIVKTKFTDTVTIDGGSKIVTGDEVLNTSSATKLNIVGESKMNYTQMSGTITVD
ncbi:MAG: hypothetical protein H7196_02630 [candidate division SR1 bacterium]|nr:hypothetical protein [candidate division SR1 bacterium]